MTEKVPTPERAANGLPLCSQAGCALFDGKRCEAIGFRPDRFCEPVLVETRDALRRLANAFAVDPNLTPTRVGVLIFEEVTDKLRESRDTADALRQEIVALRMAKLEVITAAQDLAKEAEREKLKLINLRGQNTRLLSLLRACPFGHANGQVNTSRSSTNAELVAWVEEVHTEARRPADGADGNHEAATGTGGAGGAASTPQTPAAPGGATSFSDRTEAPPAKLPPGWFLLKTVVPFDRSDINTRINHGPWIRVQVSQVSSVTPSHTLVGLSYVTLSSGTACFVRQDPDSLLHDLWRARAQPKSCPKCGMGISAAFPECWCSL